MEEAKARRQPVNTGIGVGGSSVLMVFVVLCLTTFAVLSLVSSRADLRLSQKAAQSVTAYYKADALGQLLLSSLGSLEGEAGVLSAQAEALPYVTDCRAGADGAVVAYFAIPVTETQTLMGEAELSGLAGGGGLRLLRYQVEVADYNAPDRMNVWPGGVPNE